MPAFEIGTIVVKTSGREAGRKAVITDIIDRNYVLITGPKDVTGVRTRRANLAHLEPTADKIEIKKGANEAAVKKALDAAGLTETMKEKLEF